MVKEKRKARLNKGESGGTEFIGFSAFAASTTPTTTTSPSPSDGNSTSVSSPASTSASNTSSLSPIYTGNDEYLALLFPKIGQKRDSTTKSKALTELVNYFQDTAKLKRQQVEALQYFLYLYHTKLGYDSTSKIRALCVQVCLYAKQRIPKAWKSIVCNDNAMMTSKNNPIEIIGMILCSRADPASEVRIIANEFSKSLLVEEDDNNINNDNNNNNKGEQHSTDTTSSLDPCSYGGIWTYVSRILLYTKPITMYQDLFQKGTATTGSVPSLSEQQKEELEEKYERIVGTAIDGLQLYLQEPIVQSYIMTQHNLNKEGGNDNDDNNDNDKIQQQTPETTKFLWKTITSNKPSLRRKTYNLLSTTCQKYNWWIDTDKSSKVLLQALSSEKYPSNISSLLETMIAYVASLSQEVRTNVMVQYIKPLSKVFKKGCYGASAIQWTPMVLPIIALLPPNITSSDENDTLPPQVNILTCVREGRSHAVGIADSLQVIQAVAETSTFLLLQQPKHQSDQIDQTFQEIVAKCWIQSLESYLTINETKMKGPILQAHSKLGQTLSHGWIQFHQACHNKPQSPIYGISYFFWKQEIPKIIVSQSVNNQHLTTLLKELTSLLKSSSNAKASSFETSDVSLFAPILRQKFMTLLEPTKTKSNWVPTTDIYRLWITILQLVPSTTIYLNDDKGHDNLVMNQIVPWLVRHTSSLSKQLDQQLAVLDVTLFHNLSPPDSKNGTMQWTVVLREVIASKPDLQILMDCLTTLWKNGWKVVDFISDVFSDFCIAAAKTAVHDATNVNHHHHHHHHHMTEDDLESDATEQMPDEDYLKKCKFFQTCVGLDGNGITEPLVDKDVVNTWVNCACPNDNNKADTNIGANPVLDTLVAMVQADKLSDYDDVVVHRILVQSWRQGGLLWNDRVLPWLLRTENLQLRSSIIAIVSQESKNEISNLAKKSDFDDDLGWNWTERAHRLLQMCHVSTKDDHPKQSLSVVGLGDILLWEKSNSQYLQRCLMRLLRHIECSMRWNMFSESVTDSFELLVAILVTMSSGSESPLKADSARCRTDACAKLLLELDFKMLDPQILDSSIDSCIRALSSCMREPSVRPKKVCQTVAVLSQLVGCRFAYLVTDQVMDGESDRIDAAEAQTGDEVWYITDKDDPSVREKCSIAKIHNDVPGELYFTIKLNRDGETQERQTLLERLRKQDFANENIATDKPTHGCVNVDKIDDSEKAERERLVNKLLDDLIVPFSESWELPCYELFSLIVSQCGLLGNRGIGSLHYSFLQRLLLLQRKLQSLLDTSSHNREDLATTLWSLALSLGYGMNIPTFQQAITLTGLQVSDCLQGFLRFVDSEEYVSVEEMDCAVVAYLTICAPACKELDLREKAFTRLFQTAARLFSYNQDEFHKSQYIALRGIEAGQAESHQSKQGESLLEDSEAEALVGFITAFSVQWKGSTEFTAEYSNWSSLPVFEDVMQASLKHRPRLMANASRQCIGKIVRALYVPCKRIYATQILNAYAENGTPLHEGDCEDDIINPLTLERLAKWSQNLLEEEAEELEDEVDIVAQWVCSEQMNDVEKWHEDDNINDEIACGRMLCWLLFLQIMDTASSRDSIIQPAFTSYISRCEAVSAMLDLAMIYANIGTERKIKIDSVIPLQKILQLHNSSAQVELSKLAALTIFRSVEVFPTLSKNWWEMHCPSYLTQTVKEFVETQVSPEILKQSMLSIKQASAFGEMKVKGSSVTREVTAMYVQDDFTLSVIIKLPPSFPFRRAEVDCSKTLGVPESRWKRWSLQISQMLNNQGGTLKDALLLWKENVDKEFEGIEPCPVCYSVLHVKTHKLPNMECKTCKNQFHSDCLFEWFRSSGKSACVICQQPWSGTRI